MPPFHVKDEDDYILWIEELIQSAGGWLQGILEYELLEVAQGVYYGLTVRKTQVFFPQDGSVLSFGIHIDGELAPGKYDFDYRDKNGKLIWRKDMHIGHEYLGSLEHIHRGPEGEGAPEKYDPVEIDEVLKEIAEYQEDGTLP